MIHEQRKPRFMTRLLSWLLATAIMIGLIPFYAIPAFAATVPTLKDGELDPAKVPGFTMSGGRYVLTASNAASVFSNWDFVSQNWSAPFITNMLEEGIAYGLKLSDGTYYMPIVEYITGADAMGVSMIYYYSKNSNGYRVYRGASGSGWAARQDTYKNSGVYFFDATGRQDSQFINIFKQIAGSSTFTRKEAFLLIAFCIQQQSGGVVKLSDYSGTKFGYMADGKTVMECWDDSSKSFHSPSNPVEDYWNIQLGGYPTYFIQSMNMLMDLGVMRGRSNEGSITISMEGTITYPEFYTMLTQVEGDGSSGGGWEPTPYSDIDPDLNIKGQNTSISYRDFLDGEAASLRVTLDASGTKSRQPVTNYAFDVSDNYSNSDSVDSKSSSKSFTFDYFAKDFGFTEAIAFQNNGEKSYSIKYDGSVDVTDSLDTTEGTTATGTGKVNIINEQPIAKFTTSTDILNGGNYAPRFFYVGCPISVVDKSSDYEDALEEWVYTIKYNGATIASSENFGNIRVTGNSYIKEFTGDLATKKHSITFGAAGTYVIEAYCIDEMGLRSEKFTQTITVTGEPAAPTAKIDAKDFTYMNFDTKLTDASTDPNDDIVTWDWTEVWYFDEVLDENGDGTGHGEWINVTGKTGNKDNPDAYYNGTFNDQTRKADGSYTTATATLQFTRYGTYRIYLHVTDATGLDNTGYHDVTVLEDIPVIDVGDNPVPPQESVKYTVTFINTDGTVTSVEVPGGSYISSEKVPTIVDKDGVYEHGWTRDGMKVEEPTKVQVNGNITFVVFTTPEDENQNLHTVTFINTDGHTTSVKVPHGGSLSASDVPEIVNAPGVNEIGWTDNDTDVVEPTTTVVDRDLVFWVLTTPVEEKSHTIIFINTDGSVVKNEVPEGENIPKDKIPGIIDIPGFTENGWTSDGETIVSDPSTIVPDKDMVFRVDKDPEGDNTHDVIFVNTDGEKVVVKVPDGEKIPVEKIPGIVDLPDVVENGWTDGDKVFNDPNEIGNIVVNDDLVFWVDTDKENDDTHDIIFVNTDGETVIIKVPNGESIPKDKIPDIVDLPGLIENGWITDGQLVEDPSTIIPDKDMVFHVDTDPEEKEICIVTFINTDGSTVTVEVPKGGYVDSSDVPNIIDVDNLIENGWTFDGTTVTDPTKVQINDDTVFWVDTSEEKTDPDSDLPYFDKEGRLVVKQNRAALIDVTESLSPPNDPIQVEKTEWVLGSVNGYDLNNVKFQGGKASGLKAIFLAKEPGEFTVTITLHNNYSDQLAQDKPDSNKLKARTATITVIVYPDEPPAASLFVNNANPNFHNNPTSAEITVASSATSPDGDAIGKYEWSIIRDENNDGNYEETPLYENQGTNLPTVTFPVTFQSGVVGTFLAKLKVTETPGQLSLPEYMEEDDNLSAETEKVFEVNWTPCISYDFKLNGNAWAYVDDVIPIKAKVLDENTATCAVKWTLKKKVGNSYLPVDTSNFTVWDFGTLGGELRIEEDGFYVLEAVITDDHGYSESFVSNEIRIYNLPTAVISDDPTYRWLDTQWQYKQSRRFDLDGTASHADDSTGEALHQIDHSLDTWTITPISDGASADAIYVLADDGKTRLESEETTYFCASKNEFDEQIAIIEPGTYRVGYQVTNTYGKKSEIVYQDITIVKDNEPIISIGTPATHEYLGSAADDRYVTIGMTNVNISSDDMDIVGTDQNYQAQYRYDSNNDGNFDDETWTDCNIKSEANGDNSKLQLSMTADVNQVGWYQFRLYIKEEFGQPTLDSIIPDDCKMSYEFFHEVEVDNSRPQGTFDVSNTVYGDITFVLGRTDDASEISEKTLNFGNSFGEVEGADVFQLDVDTIENVFDCEFALHTTWDTRSDMDTHIYLYNASGGLVNHIYYGNRSGSGVQLNQDDTSGGNSGDQNVTKPNTGGGEWFTIDFPNLDSTVTKMVVQIHAYRGTATTTVSLINTTKEEIVLQQTEFVSGTVDFGQLLKGKSDIWDFYDPNGGFFSGSGSKTLVECLTDVTFNANHDVFVVWAEDEIPQELDKTSPTYEEDYANLLSLLVSQNIHLIILGSSENEAVMKELLTQCLVPGIFINAGSVDDDLDEAREFIASVLRKASGTNVKYVLVNEESVYSKFFTDFNGHDHWFAGGYLTDEKGNIVKDEDGNPIGIDTILSSKWWYSHDPEYFLNSMGLYDLNQTWQPEEVTMFTQTGRYYVDYKVKDNSVPDAYKNDNSSENPFDEYRYWSNNYGNDEYNEKGELSNPYAEIYVHRRPLAEFNFTAHMSPTEELTGIDITDAAYDLDHYESGNPKSHPTKGLQMYEWTWQLANDPSSKKTATFTDVNVAQQWINEQLASIKYDSTTNVLVSYRVRDIDGVEKEQTVVYTHQIGAINGESIYKAPENSYHHTTLDKDLVVNGVVVAPAGTYVTTDYEEAVSELRAALAEREQELAEATADYNNKEAAAQQADAEATTAEKAADQAEASRDNKQSEVNNQTNVVTQKESALKDATQKETDSLNALNAAKEAAQTALDSYTASQSDYATKKGVYDGAYAAWDNENAVQTQIDADTAALEAKHDAGEISDDDYNTQLADLTAKKNASIEKQQKLWNEDVVPAKTAMDAASADMESKKSAYEAKKAEVDSCQKGYDAAVASKNAAQTDLNNANDKLVSLKNELVSLTDAAQKARETATNLRADSDKARQDADTAKAARDAAQKARDDAQKAIDDVRPLTTDQTVWVTTTEKQLIPDGVWSFYNTVRITGNPIPPVAKFVTNKIYYDVNEDISITDKSYSPNGNEITTWDWTITGGVNKIEKHVTYTTLPNKQIQVSDVTDMQNRISTFVTDLINQQPLGMTNEENTYKITLVVTDNKSVPLQSDAYSVSVVIVPGNNAPTIDPNNPLAPGGSDDDNKNTSIYEKNTLLVYEYDAYDANEANPFYTYKGQTQYRGSEYLDWTVILGDPDNNDKYGPANDTEVYTLDYLLERFQKANILGIDSTITTDDVRGYGPLNLTAEEALNNEKVAPFITVKDGKIPWGAYRITTTVTDNPKNGSAGKSTSIVTNSDTVPKHLYVIPKLFLSNIHFSWEGVMDTEEQVPVGDTVTITFQTCAETTSAFVVMPDGLGGEQKFAAILVSTTDTGEKVWSADAIIPDSVEEDDLVDGKGYTFYVEANTTYGSTDGTITRTKRAAHSMNVLAIKLYDFRITNITDPAVQFDGDPVYVPNLAYDNTNSPAGVLMKKGYSFYFELTSMGLKNDTDTICIKPSFYLKDENGSWIPVDVYYKNSDGEYVLGTYDPNAPTAAEDTFRMYANGQGGSVLGTMRKLILDSDDRKIDGKEQTWSGRFGLPSTAVFVKKGMPLSSNNLVTGQILITFDIEALKDGVTKYDYIDRGQWHAERLNSSGQYINATKAPYMDGSVIVIDGNKTALDNYESLPVWRKS